MCDYGKMVAIKNLERGKAQGVMEGILSSIKNLMETSNMNAVQAMNALKVPESDRAMYTAKLSK